MVVNLEKSSSIQLWIQKTDRQANEHINNTAQRRIHDSQGAPLYYFWQQFARKYMKIKKIGREGVRPNFQYVDPPLQLPSDSIPFCNLILMHQGRGMTPCLPGSQTANVGSISGFIIWTYKFQEVNKFYLLTVIGGFRNARLGTIFFIFMPFWGQFG